MLNRQSGDVPLNCLFLVQPTSFRRPSLGPIFAMAILTSRLNKTSSRAAVHPRFNRYTHLLDQGNADRYSHPAEADCCQQSNTYTAPSRYFIENRPPEISRVGESHSRAFHLHPTPFQRRISLVRRRSECRD